MKSTAAAEVWDADVLTAPALPLGSGAASLLAMPLQLRLVLLLLLLLLLLLPLLLPLRLASRLLLLSQWQWASALVCPRRSPRPKYRPGPNHTRYLAGQQSRTEWKRCGQPSCSTHRGSREAGVADSE